MNKRTPIIAGLVDALAIIVFVAIGRRNLRSAGHQRQRNCSECHPGTRGPRTEASLPTMCGHVHALIPECAIVWITFACRLHHVEHHIVSYSSWTLTGMLRCRTSSE